MNILSNKIAFNYSFMLNFLIESEIVTYIKSLSKKIQEYVSILPKLAFKFSFLLS
jgi:hypothetical protein